MSGKQWRDCACTKRGKYRIVAPCDTKCVMNVWQTAALSSLGEDDARLNTYSTSSLYVLCIRMSPLRFSIYRAAQAHAMMLLPWKQLEIYVLKQGAAKTERRFQKRSTAALTVNLDNQPDDDNELRK